MLPATVGIHEAPEESSRASSHRSDTELELGDRTLRGWKFVDRTLMWDSQEVNLFSEILRDLRCSRGELLWKFTFADLVLIYKRSCTKLVLVNFVPYQLRRRTFLPRVTKTS